MSKVKLRQGDEHFFQYWDVDVYCWKLCLPKS